MIIGISGLCIDPSGACRIAGAGKSSVSSLLCATHSFVELAFSDVMKRFCQEVFEFTDEQLWGESEKRVLPDARYQRPLTPPSKPEDGGDVEYLTPRFALQTLGDGWGRGCYSRVWIDYAIRIIQRLQEGGYTYDPKTGLRSCIYLQDDPMVRPKTNVVVSDLRYFNEAEAIKAAGGKLVRVRRLTNIRFTSEQMNNAHGSEVELPQWDDDKFDYILGNSGPVDDLPGLVKHMVSILSGRVVAYDAEQADVPPFKRRPRTC